MQTKNSRPLSKSLRVLIAAGSVGAFLGGWALLAHAPNPYENAQSVSDTPAQNGESQLSPLPTPRARNSQDVAPQSGSGLQLLPNAQTQPQSGTQFASPFQRRIRTGGS
jgi:hypothetical protein